MLEAKLKDTHPKIAEAAQRAHGQVAIASARKAYQIYQSLFESERFKTLAAKGARSQRLLWASTSTKNPAYSDVKYVDALIGPETVNTIPMETLDAYRDHGKPAARLQEPVTETDPVLASLSALGIDLEKVTSQLIDEGIEKFAKPFSKMMDSIAQKSAEREKPKSFTSPFC